MTTPYQILAVWSDAKGHTWARVWDGRTEGDDRVDDARNARAAAVRRAAEKWRAALPTDPVPRAVERLRQLRAEVTRRHALVREAAIAYARADVGDRYILDSAIVDEERAEELLSDLRHACELVLPEAVREHEVMLYEERRAARRAESAESAEGSGS